MFSYILTHLHLIFLFFFFNDTATTEIYTLSYTTLFRSPYDVPLHRTAFPKMAVWSGIGGGSLPRRAHCTFLLHHLRRTPRSEEHTSELQSRQYLVCRLLLEKKKHISIWL